VGARMDFSIAWPSRHDGLKPAALRPDLHGQTPHGFVETPWAEGTCGMAHAGREVPGTGYGQVSQRVIMEAMQTVAGRCP